MKAALDRELGQLRAKLGIPGVSAAILFPDGTMWTGTSGLADVAARRPVTPETPFAVASISKTFTAALIVALAGEGQVGLDVSVLTYLPSLQVDARITVRELLDHTSGLNDFFFHPKIDAALLADRGRRGYRPTRFGTSASRISSPGSGYHYSNTNYLVLGMLAEAVGGRADRRAAPGPASSTRSVSPTRSTRAPKTRPFPGPWLSLRGTGLLPPIDLSGTTVAPFTSVVTAAGGAGRIASTPRTSSTGPVRCTAAMARRAVDSGRCSATSPGHRSTDTASRTASACSPSSRRATRRGVTPAACWAFGR